MQYRQAVTRWALCSALALSTAALAQQPDPAGPPPEALQAIGDITDVTVYRGRAMITRTIDVDAAPGLRELIVSDLPVHVIADSLYAESDPGVQVRSLTYRERPVQTDVREEVQAIEDRIDQLEQQMRTNRHNAKLLDKQSAYLDRLEQFTASNTTGDLSRGVLEPGAVKDVSTYLFDQRERIFDQALKLEQQHRDLDKQLQLAQRERNMITGSASHTAREAVLFLDIADDPGRVYVHYLVDNATWSPSYTARLEPESGAMRLEYLASIEQRSGESWDDVNMSLSTATPTLTARAPQLQPFELSLQRVEQQTRFGADYKQLRQQLDEEKGQIDAFRNTAGAYGKRPAPPAEPAGQSAAEFGGAAAGRVNVALPWQLDDQPDLRAYDRGLNELAERIQVLELTAAADDARSRRADEPLTESLSVTYTLPTRISLASRQGQQLVSVRKLDLDAEAYRIATPVLTDFIYVEAAARNDSDIVLLAGPMSSYLDGEFVGRSNLPSIASGEQFTAGFGVDSSLRASRKIVNMTEETLGGNRVVVIDYRLTIESFNGGDVPIRLFDRIPTADDEQVKVSLVSTSRPISDDPQYLETQRDKGILRWDLESPDGESAAAQTIVEYTLRLEYDKNMTLAGNSGDDDSAG